MFHEGDQADTQHNFNDARKHDDKITFEWHPARHLSQELVARKGEVLGDVDGNITRALEQVSALSLPSGGDSLTVFPAFTLTGRPTNADQVAAWSESEIGKTVQVLGDFATHARSYVVGSHIERAPVARNRNRTRNLCWALIDRARYI